MPNTRETIEWLKSIKEKYIHGGDDAFDEKRRQAIDYAVSVLANGVTVQEWISVKDRLPELNTKVLCCGVKGGRFIAETSEWGEGHLYWTKKDGKGCSEVTHWMPLPEPPKGE